MWPPLTRAVAVAATAATATATSTTGALETAATITTAAVAIVSPPDLLAHKYRPTSVETLNCHREQAKRLRQWILDFTNAPRNEHRRGNNYGSQSSSDSDYDHLGDMSDDSGAGDNTARKCVLLTGPPGVGKTSLVYMVANELRMHIVESHPSEKRDFKLFKTLKLANQKGKINPIARLFQITQQKQRQTNQPEQTHKQDTKRKRRKLEQANNGTADADQTGTNNQCLSLSGDSSIVLFDDVDVVFEEDGPFLKSLAEFIRDSKRPVVVTATRSIEHIKSMLVHFEHIQLNRPHVDDCVKLLREVCRKEKYLKLNKVTNCRIIAKKLNCDIRQCLNRIHFYGDGAFNNIESDISDIQNITPDFSRLSEQLGLMTARCEDDEKTDIEDDEATIIDSPTTYQENVTPSTLACYNAISLIDLMDSTFDLVDKSTLLTRWLDGKPSHRYRDQGCGHGLGEQIRQSIIELTKNVHQKELMASNDEQQNCELAPWSPIFFSDLKASMGSATHTPHPIASRLRLRPRQETRRNVISPFLSTTIEMFNGY